MLKNYITSKLIDNLAFQPTQSQEKLIDKLSTFIAKGDEHEIMMIKGYAGTGKTTLVNSLVHTLRELKQRAVLMAPTGRAAKVLYSYTGKTAWTIHKKIYKQKTGSDGLGTFVLDRNLYKDTYFIVDEASMIGSARYDSLFGTGDLLADLLHYVNNAQHCKLILIGDTAQLPPVGLDVSPALDVYELGARGYSVIEHTLTDIVRHQKDSGILYNATGVRELIRRSDPQIPSLLMNDFKDINRINGGDMLELLSDSYDQYGEEGTIVVTRSNKRANRFNTGIRGQILWKEEQISRGDLLMVVKNNYFWKDEDRNPDFIANGDIVKIERVMGFQELYGYHFADVRISLLDYGYLELDVTLNLDVLEIDGPSLTTGQMRELYAHIMEDYPDLTTRKRRSEQIMKNPYFNALQVKFAYAVTCHKAQGGQWPSVFLDQGYFTDAMLSVDYLRWLYTAMTRATERLYLVNFTPQFFSGMLEE